VGPLSVSQPILVIIDPLASIILSVWLFDEHSTNNPAKITVAVLAFAIMTAGVTALSRAAPQDLTPSAGSRRERCRIRTKNRNSGPGEPGHSDVLRAGTFRASSAFDEIVSAQRTSAQGP
jgi:hypothetical protein